MRILQVLTYIGPGNPFGGPVTVARTQAEELRKRGHHVEVIAAQPARKRRGGWTPDGLDVVGFDAHQAIPGAGFSGLVSPSLIRFVRRRLRTFDVVHVHLARDMVTLPVALTALRRGVPYVVQPHGMVDESTKPLAKVLDAIGTRRVLEGASAVLTLTSREDADVAAVIPKAALVLQRLTNGIAVPELDDRPHTGSVQVLFCSRLHERKRPVLFARAAVALADAGTDATFTMVGADEGEAENVAAVISGSSHSNRVRVTGPVEPTAVVEHLRDSDLLVLPSVNEPYPMIVLEALSVGRPVIVTDQCGLAPFVREYDCGTVIPPDDLGALADAIRHLVEDSPRRTQMGANGREAIRQHASIEAVVDRLESVYSKATHG